LSHFARHPAPKWILNGKYVESSRMPISLSIWVSVVEYRNEKSWSLY
jgi:hypothetical protein